MDDQLYLCVSWSDVGAGRQTVNDSVKIVDFGVWGSVKSWSSVNHHRLQIANSLSNIRSRDV
eukprot:scaffold55156_cov75-Cyclotella_meneghiniana.AAC.3